MPVKTINISVTVDTEVPNLHVADAIRKGLAEDIGPQWWDIRVGISSSQVEHIINTEAGVDSYDN